MPYFSKSLILHEQLRGKISIVSKVPVETKDDLSVAYTPGVARPCEVIAQDPKKARDLTIKHNSVAIVTDGSAVLGLGNIGPYAAIPVMEGKAILMKTFANIDAWPICLDTQDTDKIIEAVKHIAPVFGGINLEDIAAPRCFEVEDRLQDIGIPVFHDDQHGTAIVLLAAITNACRILKLKLSELRIVMNGAGAAGIAITKMLCGIGYDIPAENRVKDIILCDTKGVIHGKRSDLTDAKKELLKFTNLKNQTGTVKDALKGANVFIGVSKANLITADDVKSMAKNPIIFAMANPVPEIMPDEAKKGGAVIVGTGRSDFPNQINNVLAFPGIFRGALDAGAARITPNMKLAAAYALAEAVTDLSPDKILPNPLDRSIAPKVAMAVKSASAAS